ncbi:hypothetical protein FBU30_001799 [Linnemannia zychae]|nr:hypothetical protein FBU30_001799 [Linnemannia zychae]
MTALQEAHIKACQDLDDLMLEYISLVNQHLVARTNISTRFQQGRELISQAKYIMGPKNVSADCYDHRMKALRGVRIEDSTAAVEIRDLRAEDLERQRFQKAQEEEEAKKEEEQGGHSRQASGTRGNDQDQQSSQMGLRRRGGGGGKTSVDSGEINMNNDKRPLLPSASVAGMATTESLGTGEEMSKTVKKKKERNPDPLLWFGVFVPVSLRNAQSIFQQGLQDVVEMAMIQHKLIELEKKAVTLREAKAASTKQLETDLSEMKL